MKRISFLAVALLVGVAIARAQAPATGSYSPGKLSNAYQLHPFADGSFAPLPGTPALAPMGVYIGNASMIFTEHTEFDPAWRLINAGWPAGVDNRLNADGAATSIVSTLAARGLNASAKGTCPGCRLTNIPSADYLATINNLTQGWKAMNRSSFVVGGVLDIPPYPTVPNVPSLTTYARVAGAYTSVSHDYDMLANDNPYLLTITAAGERFNNINTDPNGAITGSNLDHLRGGVATSKNSLLVGRMNASPPITSPVMIASPNACFGPTDDLRIKPEIMCVGDNVSAAKFISNDPANTTSYYANKSSFYIPAASVIGIGALVQQDYYQSMHRTAWLQAATLKALLIHTAMPMASAAATRAPTITGGYGHVDARAAVEAIRDRGGASRIEELDLLNGTSRTIALPTRLLTGNNEVLVSICWNDPAAPGPAEETITASNSNTAALVNDLDLLVYEYNAQGTISNTFRPWHIERGPGNALFTSQTGTNDRDVYERTFFTALPYHTYSAVITHKNNLVGGHQPYAFIVTGLGADGEMQVPYCPTSLPLPQPITYSAAFNATGTITAGSSVSGATTGLFAPSVILGNGFRSTSSSLMISADGNCNNVNFAASARQAHSGSWEGDHNSAFTALPEGLFPNPTEGMATLNSPAGLHAVTVADMCGKVLQRCSLPAGAATYRLDIGDLNQGVYMVTATLADGSIRTYKLVKR